MLNWKCYFVVDDLASFTLTFSLRYVSCISSPVVSIGPLTMIGGNRTHNLQENVLQRYRLNYSVLRYFIKWHFDNTMVGTNFSVVG